MNLTALRVMDALSSGKTFSFTSDIYQGVIDK